MKKDSNQILMENIDQGIKAGVRAALIRHKKLGQSIAVWENGKVKIIPANKIKIKP